VEVKELSFSSLASLKNCPRNNFTVSSTVEFSAKVRVIGRKRSKRVLRSMPTPGFEGELG
jgi:hypothetical protein